MELSSNVTETDGGAPTVVTGTNIIIPTLVYNLVVWFLVSTIIILSMFLVIVVGPTFLRWIRSKMPITPRRINRRYETIERWLITKVRNTNTASITWDRDVSIGGGDTCGLFRDNMRVFC